ncbi:MerC domain-containing protein [Rhodopirellula sallentina]|uniref:Signal peptide-domain containing protein n=1 Tax=Rhodopirellula sallentina SM41 TaxID=1263870 RepID=M5UPX4_9BACT|nr:MerC domain-containing protein [Rhodopirellula sallentina]EMI58048.1 signal peptide-domain containing protein [Rhodopirellula sallentina SM41]
MIELTTLPSNAITEESSDNSTWRDWVGIVASIGCAIHCAAMPFVIAFLPALGLSFLADESFHQWMALACFLIAIAAFVPGFRKHRRMTPIAIASVGLVLITSAAFGMAGDCCAACETSTIAATDAAVCTDACCEHCTAIAGTETNTDVTQTSVSGVASAGNPEVDSEFQAFIAPFAAWITPIGGLLLVGAHLLNRRYGCLCGCCEPAQAIVRSA